MKLFTQSLGLPKKDIKKAPWLESALELFVEKY
jgi:hypothetical protein